jgi:antirestriction protein ArdC
MSRAEKPLAEAQERKDVYTRVTERIIGDLEKAFGRG